MAIRIQSGLTDYKRLIRGTNASPEPLVQNLQPPFTIFCRIKQAVLPGVLGGSIIKFDRIPPGFGGNLDYYILQITSDAGNLRFGMNASDFGSDDTAFSNVKLLNTPYNIAGACVTTSLRHMIVDGVLESTNAAFSEPGGLEGLIIGTSYTSNEGVYNKPIGDACIQDLCVWRQYITPEELATLNDGSSPLSIHLENIIFWIPFVDGPSATSAYEFVTIPGVPTAIPLTEEGGGGIGTVTTCNDSGFPAIPPAEIGQGVGGSGMQLEAIGCVLIAQPFDLAANGFIRDLNSVLELGPFRFVEQKESDETSMITTLVLGLTEVDIGLLVEIDMSLLSSSIDMATLVDVLGDDIEIDMGEGVDNSDDFTCELLGNDDGSTYPGAPIEFKPEVLSVIEDRGSVKQYSPLGYSYIYHRVRLKATQVDEKFAVKFVDISGQLTGRYF